MASKERLAPSLGWIRRTSWLAPVLAVDLGLEQLGRRPAELDGDLGGALGQPLAGPQEERHAGPPPGVQLQPHGDVGLGRRVGRDALLLKVAGDLLALDRAGRVLGPHDVAIDVLGLPVRAVLCSTLTFSLRTASAERSTGGSIATRREQLHHVVLDHVADRAGGVVIGAPAAGHAHLLGHRDLHRADVPAVPDRLEDAVAEPEGQDVLHRLLAQVMVDAIDLALVEHA